MAARELALGGLTVTLLEQGDRLGGTVARHTVAGIDLDAGAESFATRGGTVAALAESLGLGSEIVRPDSRGAWLQPAGAPAARIPELTLLGIPGSPMAADVAAILGGGAAFRAFLETLMPAPFGAKSGSVGELVRKRMGNAVVEKLVDPITRGVHSRSADELDLDRAVPGLRAEMLRTGSLAAAVRALRLDGRAGSAVAGIRGGIYRLVVELAADLERFGVDVRLGVRATAVEPGRVTTESEVLTGEVVVAAPGLFAEGSPQAHRVVLATLVVDEPALDAAPRGTGVLVAEGAAGIHAKALTHATVKWPWLAERAEGKHVLRLSYVTSRDDLRAVAVADASALLGVRLSPPSVVGFAHVEWWRPREPEHAPAGIWQVGEAAAGTGLAAVVKQSQAQSAALIRDLGGRAGLL